MEPLTLDFSRVLSLSDDVFFRLCESNPNLRIERNAEGELEIMSPSGGRTGNRNIQIVTDLEIWNRQTASGYVFDSSTGFKLPDSAVRAPDAAWVAADRWDGLSEEEKERFPPLCPDFVVELRSPSDWLGKVEQKMDEWIANGCRLAWLIDPARAEATVYRPDGRAETVPFDAVLSGEDVLPGFELSLDKLR